MPYKTKKNHMHRYFELSYCKWPKPPHIQASHMALQCCWKPEILLQLATHTFYITTNYECCILVN